jgi:flagellar hook-associated protein 3 FlgL
MEDAVGWLETTDGALSSANEGLQRAREIAVTGCNGTQNTDSLDALAAEVDTMVEEMVQIGNTNYAGKYIFGGAKTVQAPFESITDGSDDASITGVQFIDASFDESMLDSTYQINIPIDTGVTMNISAGQKTFHTDEDGNDQICAVFDKIIALRDQLQAGDQDAVNDLIADFDTLIDNVLEERAVVGAQTNRLESAEDRSSTYELNLTTLIDQLGSVDYAEATIDYSTQESVYEASLSTAAQLIQPSLLDFLN